jgi:quercetin dioxygenase-like cupin family protein
MTMTFQQFQSDALARGFDEVVVRRWTPNQVVDEHHHPFAADALVVEGEMWLTEASGTRHLLPGDTFALEPDVPHSERYGAEGATYWVARRTRKVA